MSADATLWQVLQYSDALDLELAQALACRGLVRLWEPDRSFLPWRPGFQERPHRQPGSSLEIRRFPLLRGYARPPWSWIARVGPRISRRLQRAVAQPQKSPLVCTTPYFAAVAEQWPGPVIYWLTDLMAAYEGAHRRRVVALDRRLCRVATLVCPNSERLALYLREQSGCPADRIVILPNATNRSNVLPAPASSPGELGLHLRGASRPLAGVIGNLSENMDWVFLKDLLERTPWLHWAFVGPTDMPIRDPQQRAARVAVQRHPRTLFTGAQPYRELYLYARTLDVAVLPYMRREPTYSGSSTRFYDHLAACRPIIATAGVAELESRTDLLTLVHTPEEAEAELRRLRANHFEDGREKRRWEASRQNTWLSRADTMQAALESRLEPGTPAGT